MTFKGVFSAIAALLVIALCLVSGYKYHAYTHPVTTTTDTIMVYDTITHVIPVTEYVYKVDTVYYPEIVEIPADVDTALILRDYFAIYAYERSWSDSTVFVNFSDTLSRNRIIGSSLLSYKLLKPQTTIINKTEITNYSSYLNIHASSDFGVQYPEIGISFVGRRYSVGAEYAIRQEAFKLSLGYNIIKFK